MRFRAPNRRELLASGAAMLVAAPMPLRAGQSEDARLNTFLDDAFDRLMARSPIRQSRIGVKTQQDRWDDISEAYAIEGAAEARSDLEALKGFNLSRLSHEAAISYRMFAFETRQQLEDFRWRRNNYLVSPMGGIHSTVAVTLQNNHPIETRADAAAYISRLSRVRPLMGQLVVELERQEAAGASLPRFSYDLVISDVENLLRGAPLEAGAADNPIFSDFKTKIADRPWPDSEKAAFTAQAAAALRDDFGPGYRDLLAYLKRAQLRATDDAGVWKLPQGQAYYRYKLEEATTLPETAAALHALGLREMERIHGEMRGVMKELGHTGSLQDFFEFIRSDPALFYPNDDAGRAQFLNDATALLAEVVAREDEFLLHKPKSPIVVQAVEAWRAKSSPKAFYHHAPPDASRPGIFYINLYDMRAAPKYQLAAELFHEAVPGHHIETMLAYERTGLPKFRRFASIAAYSEGWALYSEGLAKELGLYKDPYQEFGRLSLAAMRAGRLVVDTGIHAMKWTREQATKYFDDNIPGTHYDNLREIDRYIVDPGVATAYYVGMMKILALRTKAKAALGAKFDLRTFHDAVLREGPVPLPMLEDDIDAWIASARS